MRTSVAACAAFLLLTALAGIGASLWMVFRAVSFASTLKGDAGIEVIITVGAAALVPFLIGTIALVGVGVIFAVNQSRDEQLTVLRHTMYAVESLRGAPPPGNTASPYVINR